MQYTLWWGPPHSFVLGSDFFNIFFRTGWNCLEMAFHIQHSFFPHFLQHCALKCILFQCMLFHHFLPISKSTWCLLSPLLGQRMCGNSNSSISSYKIKIIIYRIFQGGGRNAVRDWMKQIYVLGEPAGVNVYLWPTKKENWVYEFLWTFYVKCFQPTDG